MEGDRCWKVDIRYGLTGRGNLGRPGEKMINEAEQVESVSPDGKKKNKTIRRMKRRRWR
jgi:hypothetical protein